MWRRLSSVLLLAVLLVLCCGQTYGGAIVGRGTHARHHRLFNNLYQTPQFVQRRRQDDAPAEQTEPAPAAEPAPGDETAEGVTPESETPAPEEGGDGSVADTEATPLPSISELPGAPEGLVDVPLEEEKDEPEPETPSVSFDPVPNQLDLAAQEENAEDAAEAGAEAEAQGGEGEEGGGGEEEKPQVNSAEVKSSIESNLEHAKRVAEAMRKRAQQQQEWLNRVAEIIGDYQRQENEGKEKLERLQRDAARAEAVAGSLTKAHLHYRLSHNLHHLQKEIADMDLESGGDEAEASNQLLKDMQTHMTELQKELGSLDEVRVHSKLSEATNVLDDISLEE